MHDHTPDDEAPRNAEDAPGGAAAPPPGDAAAAGPGAGEATPMPEAAPVAAGPPAGTPPAQASLREAHAHFPAAEAPAEPGAGLPGGPRLLAWLIVLGVTGAASLVFQLQEAAALIAMSGMFVAAQAADLYPDRRFLYRMIEWTVPVIGAIVFGALGFVVSQQEPAPLQIAVMAFSAAAALVSLATLLPPLADALSRVFFRRQAPSHALRLAARVVLMGLLLAFPGWYAFRDTFEEMLTSSPSLFEQGFLGSGLIGYVVLAFAAVGALVRRDLPATLERLGLRPLKPGDYAVIPFGVLLLFGLNLALETVQRIWFTDMWLSDQRVSQLIAAELGPMQILMLGLSAGIGEEITMRGALQPRLGVVLTSLLFAALHIQYSWFGMGVIFGFGLLLGVLRNRTSTTVVMAIHTIYDIAAVMAMPGPT